MKSFFLSALLITSTSFAAVPQYSITPLGTLGGEESFALDINENGYIVGNALTESGITHAFVATKPGNSWVMTDLGTLGSSSSEANAINNKNNIVGVFSYFLENNTKTVDHAFISEYINNIWVMTDLHPSNNNFANTNNIDSSNAQDINDTDQIVGNNSGLRGAPFESGRRNSTFVAVREGQNWPLTDLLSDISGFSSEGNAINNNGQLAIIREFIRPFKVQAISATYQGNNWSVSEVTETETIASDNNNLNQITGSRRIEEGGSKIWHAMIASSDSDNQWVVTDLGTLDGGESKANSINDSSWVVGKSNTKAFLYAEGEMHSLMDLVIEGQEGWSNLEEAKDINNLNQVVGTGLYNGKKMAFVMTPKDDDDGGNDSSATPVCEMGVDPGNIKAGEGTALWWWSENVTSGTINNGIGEINDPSGYKWIYPTKTTEYVTTAKGTNGSTTKCTTKIIVEGEATLPPLCELGADPQVISAGEGTALWWWSENVSTATIDNGIGSVTVPSDYTWFHPKQTTTYTMTTQGNDGNTSTCSTTITVK